MAATGTIDTRNIDLLSAEQILPVQMVAGYAANGTLRMWAASLHDAVRVLRGEITVTPRDRRRAYLWITSQSEETGSFLWVASHLGLSPELIRRYVA